MNFHTPDAAPADIPRQWTPHWSPEQTDPSLPPITLIHDPDDRPAHTTTALAAHQPAHGRITVHPTPLATAPAYLAHDLIRALGKHLPPPDIEPPWWVKNADEAWRVVAAWTQALGISHYIVCRAHRITGRHLEHLMALRERTRIHLTLVVSGPPPGALTGILNAVAHSQLDTLEAAHRHLNTAHDTSPPPADRYPWWQPAPFPTPHDEPWYQLPRRPRRPAGLPYDSTTRLPSSDNPPNAITLPALTHPADTSPHHETVARRIHTRVGHPLHAAAVAIRALAGYGTDQLTRLTIPTPHHPQADLPADLPHWAHLLLEAARLHTDLQAFIRRDLPAHHSGANRPFRFTDWELDHVAHATETCHLVAVPVTRRTKTSRKSRR
ncbi:hypothetical protein [Streptomyces sp. Tue6028]|uniref:hypothetical protein n=1 Tax=Streptomyces sp. Tue6028 TaxID=2036037 RepID=UPI003EBABAA9